MQEKRRRRMRKRRRRGKGVGWGGGDAKEGFDLTGKPRKEKEEKPCCL